jgi:transcriptional regulator with XRE-family HTH domain
MLANLKTALAARGVKQADLAPKLKIPPSVLSEIIHGRRSPSESLRARISEELRADEGWLFQTYTAIPAPRGLECGATLAPACAGR